MIPLCPDCDTPMLIIELHDVEVDLCDRCHGVWLDEGELELLSHSAADDPLVQAQQQARDSRHAGSPGAAARPKRRCPRCSRPIEVVTLGRDPQLELDRCHEGHGLWFDAGELRQLLTQLGPGAGPSVRLLDELFAPPAEPQANTKP